VKIITIKAQLDDGRVVELVESKGCRGCIAVLHGRLCEELAPPDFETWLCDAKFNSGKNYVWKEIK